MAGGPLGSLRGAVPASQPTLLPPGPPAVAGATVAVAATVAAVAMAATVAAAMAATVAAAAVAAFAAAVARGARCCASRSESTLPRLRVGPG
jgi:hypothetical protein